MEPNPIQKNGSKRFLNLKKCARIRIERFKFWKNLAQTCTQGRNRHINFKMSEIRLEVPSKRKKPNTTGSNLKLKTSLVRVICKVT
jgi:hypothetical protein